MEDGEIRAVNVIVTINQEQLHPSIYIEGIADANPPAPAADVPTPPDPAPKSRPKNPSPLVNRPIRG
jgi:hypothetical protein